MATKITYACEDWSGKTTAQRVTAADLQAASGFILLFVDATNDFAYFVKTIADMS